MKEEILFQLDIGWQLFLYHCTDLEDEEALWCKTSHGLQVRRQAEMWVADWPDTEAYTIGPPSIAWILWHMMYWWKGTLSASKENQILEREEVIWPGSVALAIQELKGCYDDWAAFLGAMTEQEFRSGELCRWPFEGKSMYALALWLNAELMKNVAEIGAGRFLYAVREE